jgi:hypothetical protein
MAAKASPQQPAFDQGKMYVWIKGVETKVNNLIRELDVIKNDFIRKANDLKDNVKSLNDDMLELKREQEKTSQNMDLIIKELKKTAGIEEVQTIKKYIEFWNPMNFVTQRDLDRAIEAKLSIKQSEEAKQNGNNRRSPTTKKPGTD